MAISRNKENERFVLSEILPEGINDLNDSLGFNVIEKAKQRRIDLYHNVVHALAIIIVIPYVFMILFGLEVPSSYSTTVSMVIGFYFAKSLF